MANIQKTEKNPKGAGRTPGARNRSSLIRTQLEFDGAAPLAAKKLIALMNNDKEFLNISEDVPTSIILQACKTIIDKAIANEKEKEPVPASEEKSEDVVKMPRVLPKAVN